MCLQLERLLASVQHRIGPKDAGVLTALKPVMTDVNKALQKQALDILAVFCKCVYVAARACCACDLLLCRDMDAPVGKYASVFAPTLMHCCGASMSHSCIICGRGVQVSAPPLF